MPTSAHVARGTMGLASGMATTIIVVVAAAPAGAAGYVVLPTPGTYLDLFTHLVYDDEGSARGVGVEDAYTSLGIWTKGEPMATSALGVGARAGVNDPSVTLRLDPSEPVVVEGVDVAIGGVGESGLCLHDYCITADALLWGSGPLGRPVMVISWTECAAACVDQTSGPIEGRVLGNHLVWTGGFDPEPHRGAVTHLCMTIGGAPVAGRCGLADVFGHGTRVEPGCVLYKGISSCGSMVYRW